MLLRYNALKYKLSPITLDTQFSKLEWIENPIHFSITLVPNRAVLTICVAKVLSYGFFSEIIQIAS